MKLLNPYHIFLGAIIYYFYFWQLIFLTMLVIAGKCILAVVGDYVKDKIRIQFGIHSKRKTLKIDNLINKIFKVT